ncbi:MAG: hypothetical protein PHX34_02520 [Candidatus Shapirobacteria bacterium]|nr:hypothetical protein [Candidatus Shapirobacteria bacterium]
MVENKTFSSEIFLNNNIENKWQILSRQFQPVLNSEIFTDLRQHYNESHRHYHTLSHVNHCLSEFDLVKNQIKNPQAVALAIWFHDYIYDPSQKDNEEKSAQNAFNTITKNGLSSDFANTVSSLILSTKHINPSFNSDEQYLNDIDMTILGQTPDIFNIFDQKIEIEFRQIYPKDVYLGGRIKFFEAVLNRQNIFFTDFFKNKYQDTARQNIQSKKTELEIRLKSNLQN